MSLPAVLLLFLAQAPGADTERWVNVTKVDPANAHAWYSLGRSWVDLARGAYEQLLGEVPDDSPYALAVRADALMRRQQSRRGFVVFRSALQKDPDLVSAHVALAAIYRSSGHADWAAQEEKAVASLDCATHQIECDVLAGRYELALTLTLRDQTPHGLYWRAQAYTGLANAAFARLERLPPSPELHLYKAGLEYEAGHRAQVVEELRAATQLAPRDRVLRVNLAMALGAAAQYGDAFHLATDLLRDDPGSAELNALAGDALLNSQKAEESIPFLKKSAAANPGNLMTQRSLGMAYMKTGEAKLALTHLEAAAPIDGDGSIHYQLAIAYRQTRRPDMANQAMAAYQRLSTKSAPAPEPDITAPR